MRELSLALDVSISPLYLRIADALRQAIKSGRLRVAEALPSARTLASQLGCNRHTLMAAYQELVAQGWVESFERKGYRVATWLPEDLAPPPGGQVQGRGFQWRLHDSATDVTGQAPMDKPAHEYRHNFAGGMVDLAAFPFSEFKSCMDECLLRPDYADLGYGNVAGNGHFIVQVQEYLRRMRAITGKEIMAVNGSQEALYLIARLLLRPGDAVAVASLGYQPAWDAFRTAGATLVGIGQLGIGQLGTGQLGIDPQGERLDLERLKDAITGQRVRLIYLTPLHHYPTTVTLPIQDRLAIYAMAAQHNIPIVEDDYDHEFHYLCQPPAPMAADDPLGLVIYLSSFSKILFPGCRIGIMAVDASLAPALQDYRRIMNHKPNALMQGAVARWMAQGGFERHVRKMTRLYHARRDHLHALLQDYRRRGGELDYSLPAGGMALWLDIKARARALERHCRERDIYLMAEHRFQLRACDDRDRFIRLGFAAQSEAQLAEGMETVLGFLDGKGQGRKYFQLG